MDMSASIAPKSDQLDAIELVGGPRTFTIKEVTPHNNEQPWNFHLAEFSRPWRPGKSMLRVMAAAWGLDGSKYIGHRVTLYCDPTVAFGNEVTGGTRISHMTGIDKPLKVPLLIKRGKSAMFTALPLTDAEPTTDWVARIRDTTTVAELQQVWQEATQAGATRLAEVVAAKDTRKSELTEEVPND